MRWLILSNLEIKAEQTGRLLKNTPTAARRGMACDFQQPGIERGFCCVYNPPMSDPQPPKPDWPVDLLRTDDSGELDLEQIEFNLSLTVEQRMEQYRQWMEFMQIAREIGRASCRERV